MRKILTFLLSLVLLVFASSGAKAVGSYPLSEVAQHNDEADCWVAIDGEVYDVTEYIPEHDREFNIRPWCGIDATEDYHTKVGRGQDHSTRADELLADYLIGELSSAEVSAQNTVENSVPTASTATATPKKTPYNVFVPFVATIILYLLSSKILAKPKHDFVWNSIMLLGLIPSVLFGFLMAMGIKFGNMLYMHVELSIIFGTACVLHFLYRLKMYWSEARFSFRKKTGF